MLTCLLFLPGQIETKESPDFSKELQIRAITATVLVVNPATKSQGSGVIVGRDNVFVYVLTAHHVVKGANQLQISTFSEKSYPKIDKVIDGARVKAKFDDIRDLALVRMANDKTLEVLPICPASEIPKKEGFQALATGCSQGDPPTCQLKKVSGKKRIVLKAGDKDDAFFWEWLAEVPHGRSGGPLVDKRGYVIGICSVTTKDGKGYYCHPAEIHRLLDGSGFDWLVEKKK
jgi:S1-C subfamily serine protease